jgi:hypothetical protein
MNIRRYSKKLFGRILTPSYISTLIWLVTDVVEVVFLGIALSVVFAIASPFLETAAEAYHEFRGKREAQRKTTLLDHFVPFMSTYKDAVTKYPPALFSSTPGTQSLVVQLDILAQHMRTLKGAKTQAYTTSYDLVLDLSVHQGDFDHWELDDCEEFVQRILRELSAHAVGPWRVAINRFRHQPHEATWSSALATAEQDLDNAIQRELRRSPLVTLTENAPEVRARICSLLKLETFHRQAALQTYLSSPRFPCAPHEVADTIAYLRSDAVAVAFLSVLDGTPASV